MHPRAKIHGVDVSLHIILQDLLRYVTATSCLNFVCLYIIFQLTFLEARFGEASLIAYYLLSHLYHVNWFHFHNYCFNWLHVLFHSIAELILISFIN